MRVAFRFACSPDGRMSPIRIDGVGDRDVAAIIGSVGKHRQPGTRFSNWPRIDLRQFLALRS